MDELQDDAARLLADPTWTSAAYHDAGSCWKLLQVVAELGHKWQDMADKLAEALKQLDALDTATLEARCELLPAAKRSRSYDDIRTIRWSMAAALSEYDKAKKGQ